jgi:small subunit ribosomal protein S17
MSEETPTTDTPVAAAAEAPKPAAGRARGTRRVRNGEVVSKSGDKSLVVRAERRRVHPVYGKVVREFKKFHVHDEKNAAKVGDLVEIAECRPMSKMKCWRLVAVTGAKA